VDEQGPGARRRYLGKALRRLREDADLKTTRVAELMHMTQANVTRIEGGRHAILLRNVARMLEIYGVEDARADALMAMAGQASQRGWWESYGDVINDWFEIYASLEADATEIWSYEAEFVPGLFQTPDYVRAVHLAARPDSTHEQADRFVELRLERQQHIGSQQITAVINEAVARRVVGGPQVMRAQLDRLVNEIEGGRVDLRIVPFEAGAHAAMAGSFIMLRFEDTDEMDLVYTENERGAVYLERPVDLLRYTIVFDRVRDAALPATETARYLGKLAAKL
jgi:transcriptional regulator with XRE-family HTH domain